MLHSSMIMTLSQQFAELVKTKRKEEHLTQVEFAERIGTNQGNLSKIERGDWNVSLEIVERVAEGLGLKAEIVFKRKK